MPTLLIVGASLGGLRAAEQARAQGFEGRVVVVGDEGWMPYTRPPLSKDALLGPAASAVQLATAQAIRPRAAAADVEWLVGTAAVGADLGARSVALADGRALAYDALVVATGLRPRRLPQLAPARGRHALRTVDDAAGLHRELRPGMRAVVVDGGFIGCETASTLASAGADVTVIEPMATPMQRALGPDLGAALLAHHRAAGVRLVTGQGVVDLHAGDDDRVRAVVLDDGTELEADVLVESVGSQPNVEWLDGNGLDLSDGLLCDNDLRVEGRPGLVAVGDVARFPNPRFDEVPRRVEHWCMPGETARRAVASALADITGAPAPSEPFTPLPAFWSDQFGLRIQCFGMPAVADESEVLEGRLDAVADGVALLYRRDRQVVGTVLVNILVSRHGGYRSLLLDQSQLV